MLALFLPFLVYHLYSSIIVCFPHPFSPLSLIVRVSAPFAWSQNVFFFLLRMFFIASSPITYTFSTLTIPMYPRPAPSSSSYHIQLDRFKHCILYMPKDNLLLLCKMISYLLLIQIYSHTHQFNRSFILAKDASVPFPPLMLIPLTPSFPLSF